MAVLSEGTLYPSLSCNMRLMADMLTFIETPSANATVIDVAGKIQPFIVISCRYAIC